MTGWSAQAPVVLSESVVCSSLEPLVGQASSLRSTSLIAARLQMHNFAVAVVTRLEAGLRWPVRLWA